MAKQRRKKVDPRCVPVSKHDVLKAKKEATDDAITYAWAILFTVMRDKFGWGPVRLNRLWAEVNNLSGSIIQGYVKIPDLVKVLDEEAGIKLVNTLKK